MKSKMKMFNNLFFPSVLLSVVTVGIFIFLSSMIFSSKARCYNVLEKSNKGVKNKLKPVSHEKDTIYGYNIFN
jgi:hypothetical protein